MRVLLPGFPKDERLKNDTIFKQKLEDLNLTKGGSIQIETIMSLLWEKTQERERKYPWKPNQKATPQQIPVETKIKIPIGIFIVSRQLLTRKSFSSYKAHICHGAIALWGSANLTL